MQNIRKERLNSITENLTKMMEACRVSQNNTERQFELIRQLIKNKEKQTCRNQ